MCFLVLCADLSLLKLFLGAQWAWVTWDFLLYYYAVQSASKFVFGNEVTKCDHLDESCQVALSFGVVYFAFQGGSNFCVCRWNPKWWPSDWKLLSSHWAVLSCVLFIMLYVGFYLLGPWIKPFKLKLPSRAFWRCRCCTREVVLTIYECLMWSKPSHNGFLVPILINSSGFEPRDWQQLDCRGNVFLRILQFISLSKASVLQFHPGWFLQLTGFTQQAHWS